ncbi:MBL fold metallo-hydrolase [Paenibacillus sp. JX-17]|uniref:MBL fold metallo-hydrolase n=1 Tax=Paenibacillus lacisoli TaxID=3064525 RepID=A0ABT9CBV7_9BACL|nr:MBL fold metallo-hydrolase [Paenibacillus sp. JX-17]MDO7906144.1 MBL fold metallo-hydrolase [Paenibacillus sp. JX-17]
MKVTHIRNATLIVDYADKKFLIDPFLAPKGTYPPFPNAARQDQNNPLVELPMTVEAITQYVDAVILTHLHLDHFDDAAKNVLPKHIKMFVQNHADADHVEKAGFTNVEVLQQDTILDGIRMIKTPGEHGRGEILERMGQVCGVILQHSTEPSLYVAGDTVWYEAVKRTLAAHKPDIIVVNGGDNQLNEGGSLVMGKEDIAQVYQATTDSTLVVVHMEAVNHWVLSREELRHFLKSSGMITRVLVPDDGECYTF